MPNEYLSLTEIGRIYGVSSHQVGKWHKASDSAPTADRRQPKPSGRNTSPNDPARSLGHSITSGTDQERQLYSMPCSIHGPFTILSNGSIGQTVIDADGNAVAWTSDVTVAQVICGLMNEYTNNQKEGI